ncbi:hypothetical protein M3175_11625 [Robertmurraya korlensis]|uniref:hypothetical protein n=1 Tax=Robertmurraya korlensis TaxID=519977 RepID=UPI0020409FC3|nr:hypothetical protein [Robertmurraya korlensis]MCM3601384.1 hypothetical protein [Robertmurraya korlensis]
MKKFQWLLFFLLLAVAFSIGVYTAPYLNGTTQWVQSLPDVSNWNVNYNPLPFLMALSMSTILTIIKMVTAFIGWLLWSKTKKLNLVKLSGLLLFAFSIISLLPMLFAVGMIGLALFLVTKSRKRTIME